MQSTFYWRQTYQFGILSKHPRARINSTPVESVTYSIWCPTCEEFIHMKDLAAKAAKAGMSRHVLPLGHARASSNDLSCLEITQYAREKVSYATHHGIQACGSIRELRKF